MRYAYLFIAFTATLVVSIFGLRGQYSTKPPIDVFPEWAFPAMREQPRYRAQGESKYYADGRADRPLPAGVVASSHGFAGQPLRSADDHLHAGKAADGSFAAGFPKAVKVDHSFIQRGRDRYTVYCLPCHGAVGDGNGITKFYGMGATPSYHIDRLRQMPEGEIFNTITLGKATMQSYADKVDAQDRWAIIAYVRALQRAQNGSAADVPAAHKSELGIK